MDDYLQRQIRALLLNYLSAEDAALVIAQVCSIVRDYVNDVLQTWLDAAEWGVFLTKEEDDAAIEPH